MEKHQKKAETGESGDVGKKSKHDMSAGERVRLLQEKLYYKAKGERSYKFYILYDKMFVPYMLEEAYRRVKAKGGSPGVDGKDFTDIERYGKEVFLGELGEELRKRTYRPQAVKRVWIEKANGGKRPLGIPTIRDRVAQMVCKLIIEPIFEADFEDCSYGFRPGRSSKDAMKAIKAHLRKGKTEVFDADVSSYFDTIPHDKLKIVLKQRISDPRLIDLIGKWLKCPLYEDGQYKGGNKRSMGIPQGGVVSPLLANIYLHLIDRVVSKMTQTFYRQGIKIVRYADDFVLMGERIGEGSVKKLRELLVCMGLRLNEAKTRHIQARETPFQFLGFEVRYDKDLFVRGKFYWNIQPSRKSINKIKEKIRGHLKHSGHHGPDLVAQGLNALIRGWLNYFDIQGVSYPTMGKRHLRHYLVEKLYRYYNRKSQRRSRLYGTQAFDLLVNKHGLIDPSKYRVGDSKREPVKKFAGKPYAGKPHVRFDEGAGR